MPTSPVPVDSSSLKLGHPHLQFLLPPFLPVKVTRRLMESQHSPSWLGFLGFPVYVCFFICKMGLVVQSISQGCCEDKMRQRLASVR